jgi:2-dehydrotetronate isomerase
MPRFAANLTMLYNEFEFLDRFAAAAADGFAAVEYLFPYAYPAARLAEVLQANGLEQVLFNTPAGDWAASERGLACLPGREAEFRAGFETALAYASVLGCQRVHVMAGIAPSQTDVGHLRETYLSNLTWAADQAALHGRNVLIEPINTRDMPGFYLNRQDVAHQILKDVGKDNLKVQMDLYHLQIVEGDVAMKLREYLPTGRVGHIQIAGVPDRHEPDSGELNYGHLFDVIDEVSADCGWDGWLGCEYLPHLGPQPGATSSGLDWLRRSNRH